jgi:SH3-like domain-containing protein
VVGASFAERLWTVDLTPAAIVVRPGETSVRFEPTATGTEHFKVAEGTRLEITAEHEGWMQVRRSDGRRGWIQVEAVGRI